MHYITNLYYKSCLELDLNPVEMVHFDGFSVEIGKQNLVFYGGNTPFNDQANSQLSFSKYITNAQLALFGFPVPKATVITAEDFASGDWDIGDLNYPVVAKPCWYSACGRGIQCNIKSKQALEKYLRKNLKIFGVIDVEEFKSNLRSYRVLIYADIVVGLVERFPARVFGDGKQTIAELVVEQNKKRAQINEKLPYAPINFGIETQTIFEELGIDLEFVPDKNQIIPLGYRTNGAQGGSGKSLPLTDICKENIEFSINAAHALNLNYVGLDILCVDIGIPIKNSEGYIIEANCNPDIAIHENCVNGQPVQVSKEILCQVIKEHNADALKHRLKRKFRKAINASMMLGVVAIIFAALFLLG